MRWRKFSSIAAAIIPPCRSRAKGLLASTPVELMLVAQQRYAGGNARCRRDARQAPHPFAGYERGFVNYQERPGKGGTQVTQATDHVPASRNPRMVGQTPPLHGFRS